MKNIILIGMPGAGKSTIGVVLAKAMGYKFIDSDLVIQEHTGLLLHEIIEKNSLDEFNKIENRINASLDVTNSVVATGGSVIYGQEAMKHLKEMGTVVYLKLSLESISERLGDLNQRGVSIREGQTLDDLYNERTPLYEKYADIIIDCDSHSIRELVRIIMEKI